jgi:ribonuclease BN (tRNA processing enzyme)
MPKGFNCGLLIGLVAFAETLSFSPATAQGSAAQEPTNRNEILFLGTGGGPPLRTDRSEPSTLLIVDGRPYLFDCGIGTAHRLVAAKIDSKQIKTIFFTHLHADHDLGLADVMANDFFEGGQVGAAEQVDIYGPPRTRELVDAAFRFISVGFEPFAAEKVNSFRKVAGGFADPFIPHEVTGGGVIFHDDKIRVTAVENTHYSLMPKSDRGRLKSYSYRVETPHGVILFSGDTGQSDAVAHLANGADVLIAEASYPAPAALDTYGPKIAERNHWTPARLSAWRGHFLYEHLNSTQVGELASKSNARAVILYHYNPANKADAAAYVAAVKRGFGGPVFAPEDLERYCMTAGRIAPCGTTVSK